jgi:hypothetical protein
VFIRTIEDKMDQIGAMDERNLEFERSPERRLHPPEELKRQLKLAG